jgi:hypothetical protein
LIAFEALFYAFHIMFFSSQWQFSTNSLLIKLFPKVFFVDITVHIFGGIYAASLFLSLLGYYIIKKERMTFHDVFFVSFPLPRLFFEGALYNLPLLPDAS